MGIDSCCATFVVVTYAPMCIFVGECEPLGDFRPIVLVGWQQIKAWINEPK